MAKFRMQAVKPGVFEIHYKRKFWPFWMTFRHTIRRLERGYSTIYEDVSVPWTGTEEEAELFIKNLSRRDEVFK
ncbi:hypothetical protein VPHD148_0162 [Vibrio phage D148]